MGLGSSISLLLLLLNAASFTASHTPTQLQQNGELHCSRGHRKLAAERHNFTQSCKISIYGPSSSSSSSSCEASYGVLPCTDTVVGNLFLLLFYGYILFRAATYVSEGNWLFYKVLSDHAGFRLFRFLLPLLQALPDSIIILVSSLGGTTTEAEEKVLVGVGLLAGSIVMLLTGVWGSCLLVGRHDFNIQDDSSTTHKKKLTQPLDVIGTGVGNERENRWSAVIMSVSIIPFILVQQPSLFHFSAATSNIITLVACVLSLGGLVPYLIYQVLSPWVQKLQEQIARKTLMKVSLLGRLIQHSGGGTLIRENGSLDIEFAKKLFSGIDIDKDGILTKGEVWLMLKTTLVAHEGHMDDAMVDHFMEDYDVNQDNGITLEEFINGTKKWCKELQLHPRKNIQDEKEKAEDYWKEFLQFVEEEEDEGDELPTRADIIRRALALLTGGTILAAIFATPLVDSVSDFSSASHIPSFFVSFVLLPLASKSSEVISSIRFSSRKTDRGMSLAFSQIYEVVTMNNTLGLGILLAVVYGRKLEWDFSSEVLVVCLVTLVMGLLASFRKAFPTWMGGIAILLYPLSLGLVAFLTYDAGWR